MLSRRKVIGLCLMFARSRVKVLKVFARGVGDCVGECRTQQGNVDVRTTRNRLTAGDFL